MIQLGSRVQVNTIDPAISGTVTAITDQKLFKIYTIAVDPAHYDRVYEPIVTSIDEYVTELPPIACEILPPEKPDRLVVTTWGELPQFPIDVESQTVTEERSVFMNGNL